MLLTIRVRLESKATDGLLLLLCCLQPLAPQSLLDAKHLSLRYQNES